MNLVPNTPARIYTLSAFIVGYILIDDATPAEQNSLGSWFMLVGQTLCSNSAQQQVLNNRNNTATKENSHTINDSIGEDSSNKEIKEQINNMNKIINAMNQEIANLKNWL